MRRAVTMWAWLGVLATVPAAREAHAQGSQPSLKIGFISSRQILQQTPGYAAAESTFSKEVQGPCTSLLNVDSAAAYPGVCCRICRELMNPILSEGCDPCACASRAAGTVARTPSHAHIVTARLITRLPESIAVDPALPPPPGRDQKKLPSLKCSFQPGFGRPRPSVRSKPYAQSMPIGPSGEMMLMPMPAPRNSRVGLNWPARAHTFPAS